MSIEITNKAEVFGVIVSAVNKGIGLIQDTYGPAGNKVLISKVLYKTPADDGVQIARDLELENENENAVWNLVKETAIKTNDRVGDGTTGALIIVKAILNEADRLSKRDGRKIEKELKIALVEATEAIMEQSKPVSTKEELLAVARISFDNSEISEIIADAWHQVGSNGMVTIDKSPTLETTSELSEGVQIGTGYLSQYMVNNPERMECIMENVHILLTDYRITEVNDIVPIMKLMVAAGKQNLVIISENLEGKALQTLVLNEPWVMNPQTGKTGTFASVAVNAPSQDRKNFLEDLATLTGATMFSTETGSDLKDAKIEDLGKAKKFIAKAGESVVIEPQGDKKAVKEAATALEKAIENEPKESTMKRLKTRLAVFTNKVAVIRVGAPTENEYKALKYKVEDSVNAVRSAFKGGVVAGGGACLASIKTSSKLLNEALKKPHQQLCENVGVLEAEYKPGEAFNVVTGKTGSFMKVGVLDPADVLVAGIESAVSISSLLLTMSGLIVEPPAKPRQE